MLGQILTIFTPVWPLCAPKKGKNSGEEITGGQGSMAPQNTQLTPYPPIKIMVVIVTSQIFLAHFCNLPLYFFITLGQIVFKIETAKHRRYSARTSVCWDISWREKKSKLVVFAARFLAFCPLDLLLHPLTISERALPFLPEEKDDQNCKIDS